MGCLLYFLTAILCFNCVYKHFGCHGVIRVCDAKYAGFLGCFLAFAGMTAGHSSSSFFNFVSEWGYVSSFLLLLVDLLLNGFGMAYCFWGVMVPATCWHQAVWLMCIIWLAMYFKHLGKEGMRQDAGVMVLMQKLRVLQTRKSFLSGRSAVFVECWLTWLNPPS